MAAIQGIDWASVIPNLLQNPKMTLRSIFDQKGLEKEAMRYYDVASTRQAEASGLEKTAPPTPGTENYVYHGVMTPEDMNRPKISGGKIVPTPTPTPHKSMIDSFFEALNPNKGGSVLGSNAQAKMVSPTPTSTPTPTPSPTPYIFNFNNQVSKYLDKYNQPNKPTQPPENIGRIIRDTFGKDADKAALVAWSENASDPYNPAPRDNWNPPNKDGHTSWDRGLFQINSDSFNGLMQRRPDEMKQAGVSDWSDMYDPVKNAKVAKMIYDEGGWGRWFGWQNHNFNLDY